jgi:hypothetical protein
MARLTNDGLDKDDSNDKGPCTGIGVEFYFLFELHPVSLTVGSAIPE